MHGVSLLVRRSSRAAVSSPNEHCELHGKRDQGKIALHGSQKVMWGRRRRYRCKECGKAFGATTGPERGAEGGGSPLKRLFSKVIQPTPARWA